MLKDNKVYNYWNGDIYNLPVKSEAVSNIVSFVGKEDYLSLDKVYENLKKEKNIIVDLKKEEDKIVVIAKKDDVQIEVDLLMNKNEQLLGNELVSTLKMKGTNLGVSKNTLETCLKKPRVLVSTAKFDLNKPFVSYYLQYKVLASAVNYGFIFDISAKKIFPKNYEDYIDKVDSELLIDNVYSVIIGKNGWATTVGLRRFNLKEIEMNKITSLSSGFKLMKKINDNRLIKGELKEDILINYGGEQYFTVISINDLKANFSDSYLTKGVYDKGEETFKERLVLVPFSKENIDVNKLEKDADFSGFTKGELNFEIPEYLVNRVKLARQTLPFLYSALNEDNDFRFLIEFELQTDNKEEYIYAMVESLQQKEFTGYLMTDSLHNPALKKNSKVQSSLDRMINWEVNLRNRVRVNPINAYAFDIINKSLKNK